jgi:hypothetical protein
MKRGRWWNYSEVLQKRSKLGVIRVATLEEMGITSTTSYRRCLPGGPWRWLLPGVVLMQTGPPTRDQLVHGALVHAGPTAMITGVEACQRYSLRVPEDRHIHVLVSHDRRLQSNSYLKVERTRRLPIPWFQGDVPMAPKARAVIDACRRMRTPDSITQLLIDAIQIGGCTPAQLSFELESSSRRGTAIPRRILAEVAELRSVAEKDALALAKRAKLPAAMWNKQVFGPDDQYLGRPDGWWDDVALAWEVDSKSFHYRSEDYARTLARNARYTAAGIVLLQTLPARLRTEPDEVIAELQASYAAAASRPRPPVRVKS